MPGVRLARFLASTAVLLLLAAAPCGAGAESASGTEVTTAPTPDTATGTPSTDTNSNPPAASQESPNPTPAAKAKPEEAPAVPQAAESLAIPGPSPANDESTDQPAPSDVASPAPASEPAEPTGTAPATATAKPEPAAAGETSTPAPAAAAPATESPIQPAATSPVIADADAPIVERLRELGNGKFDRILGGKKDRATIDAFYSGRSYAPLWITEGKENARAKAAIAYLAQVDADGLDPADYPVPDFTSAADPGVLAEAEIKLTKSVITYAHHAQMGRVHWSRVSADISYDRTPPEPAEILAAMAEAKDVGEVLASYEPQDPAYRALKAKLAEFRAGRGESGKAPIPNGPAPKIGAHDDRVPQLRERLGVAGEGTTYDKALAEAVKTFQQDHELKPTGTLTAATIEALNGRRPDRPTDIILANMERWRWMPHDLGKSYVIVNLADFTLRVMHDGKQLWTTKVVDGKPTMPTPIMSAEMKYITVNPTWNVPPSIVNNEYLPALAQDPTVLQRAGLRLSYNSDGSVHISQPPGDKNALGRLRFNFPNKFLVYQHDTPDKYMFAYERRAYSHGCMRVQDPAKYAEVLLSIVRPGEGYTQERIRKMFGGGETDISFPNFIPVHLTYQTAFVDDAGKLQFREDVYGRDRVLLAILKGDERKIADLPIERRENSVRRQVLAIPDQWWGGRNYNAGQNFFSRLFGYPYAAQPAPVPRRPVAERRTGYYR